MGCCGWPGDQLTAGNTANTAIKLYASGKVAAAYAPFTHMLVKTEAY